MHAVFRADCLMAAEETTFYPAPAAAAMATGSYSSETTVRPESLLRKHSIPHSTYYNSLDGSSVRRKSSVTPPHLSSGTHAASPGTLASYSYLDDSSDHEREDERENSGRVKLKRTTSPDNVQLLRSSAMGDGRVECEREDRLKDDWNRPPISLTCALIPSCAVQHCEFVSCIKSS
jgi:hypothetical protein